MPSGNGIFPRWLQNYGVQLIAKDLGVPFGQRQPYFVDPANGSNARDGLSPQGALATITAALARAQAGDTIIVYPGTAIENVVVATDSITIIGAQNNQNGRPIIAPTSGVALTVTGNGFRCENMRIQPPAAVIDAVIQQGNGFVYENVKFEGNATQGAGKGLLRLQGVAADTTKVAGAGIVRGCIFRGITGNGIIFDDAATPNLAGSTGVIVEGNEFIGITGADIVTADSGAGTFSVHQAIIRGNYFADKNKATYIDFTTANGGAASDQNGIVAGNYFASDTMSTTIIKAVGTGFTFPGNYDTVGIFDGSGLD